MDPTTKLSVRPGWLTCLTLLLPLAGCELPSGTTGMRAAADGNEDVWAIRCLAIGGANRFKLADSYANALRGVADLKPDLVQVFHEEGRSAVYYGRYRRSYDARSDTESFHPSHQRDLDLIRHLSMNVPDPAAGGRTVWPFQLATVETLPVGRGSHPDWLLSNASGYYSLQVAVFYNTEGMRRRKFAAEEYCKLLRGQGEKAYYHHGQVNSSVCIDAFPEEAIQTFQDQNPLTGLIHVTAKIVDERMLALQRRFPRNLHNGSTFYDISRDPRTGKKVRDPHTSFAVEIPRPERGTDSFGG